MDMFSKLSRKAALVLSAALVGATLTVSTGAEAFTPKMPRGMAAKLSAMPMGGMGPAALGRLQGAKLIRRGLGLGAAALAGGLALGAAVPLLSPECAIEERPAVDDLGNVFYERVRVCE